MSLRVCVDYRPAQGRASRTGTGVYVDQLVRALARMPIELWCLTRAEAEFRVPGIPLERTLSVRTPLRPERWHPFWDAVLLRPMLTDKGFDVFHATVPGLFQAPCMVTSVLDLIPLLFPEELDTPIDGKLLYRWRLRSAAQSSGIITLSVSAKAEIASGLGYPGARVTSTHLAPSEHFKPLDARVTDEALVKLGLPPGYILYVGGYSARKNVVMLLAAFRKVLPEIRDQRLVLGGAVSAPVRRTIDRQINDLGLTGSVHWTGGLDNESMVALYNGARLFVYPSLYEGFGLPVVEAMACGVPVISSSRSSLPELVGDAGTMIDPLDSDALTESMLSLLRSAELRAQFAEKGLARAAQFTWERCARETILAYERAFAWEGTRSIAS